MLGEGYSEINKTVVSQKILCPKCKKQIHFLCDNIDCPYCKTKFKCEAVSVYMTSVDMEPLSGRMLKRSSFLIELLKKLWN